MPERHRVTVTHRQPGRRGAPAFQVRRSRRRDKAEEAPKPTTPVQPDPPERPSTGTEVFELVDESTNHSQWKAPASGTADLPITEAEAAHPNDAAAEPSPDADAASSVEDEASVKHAEEEEPVADDQALADDDDGEDSADAEAATDAVEPEAAAATTGGEQIVEDGTSDAPADSDEAGEPAAAIPSAEAHDYAAYARGLEEAAARSKLTAGGSTQDVGTFPVVPRREPETEPAGPQRRSSESRPRTPGPSTPRVGTRGSRKAPVIDTRPRWRRPRFWLKVVAAILGVALLVGLFWVGNLIYATYNAYNEAHVDSPERDVYQVNAEGTPVVVPSAEVQASLPNWGNKDPFNILLMGIDTREADDEEPPRSDTMIVMRVNPATNSIVMMSIPRDLLVYIPAVGDWDKINAAYPIGEARRDGAGPGLVMETIEANFDIRLHYFMTVDFKGFRKIIDTIGGVVIDVPAPIKDDLYPTEDFGYTRQYFRTGLQLMDGETALRYSRTRHGDNDLARGDRQQQMLIGIRQQAMDLGLITRATDLVRDAGAMVTTDLSFNEILALANIGRSVDNESIARINLWDAGVMTEYAVEGEPFYFQGDWPRIVRMMNTYFGTSTVDTPVPTPTSAAAAQMTVVAERQASGATYSIPLIVQNHAAVDQLASSVSMFLRESGFTTVSPETGTTLRETTVIYDYAESPETARYIAGKLGLSASSIVYGRGGTGIVIEVGRDLAWMVGD